MSEHTDPSTGTEQHRTVSRRRYLQGATAAGLAAAGVAGLSMGSAAQWDARSINVVGIPMRQDWSGYAPVEGSLPVVDEGLVFVHTTMEGNYAQEEAAVVDDAVAVADALAGAGYEPDAATVVHWETNTMLWGGGGTRADAGAKIAPLVEAFDDAGGGAIRLVGHGSGCRPVFETLSALSSGHEVETVATLDAWTNAPEVCGDPWNGALANACEVRNYYSTNAGDPNRTDATTLGIEGADCDPGDNYTDVDVSDSVESDDAFLADAAVANDLAEAILAGPCGGDSGVGGATDGGSTDGGSTSGGSTDSGSDDSGSDGGGWGDWGASSGGTTGSSDSGSWGDWGTGSGGSGDSSGGSDTSDGSSTGWW